MKKPVAFWRWETLKAWWLGRRKSRRAARVRSRQATFEPLSPRIVLAGDADVFTDSVPAVFALDNAEVGTTVSAKLSSRDVGGEDSRVDSPVPRGAAPQADEAGANANHALAADASRDRRDASASAHRGDAASDVETTSDAAGNDPARRADSATHDRSEGFSIAAYDVNGDGRVLPPGRAVGGECLAREADGP